MKKKIIISIAMLLTFTGPASGADRPPQFPRKPGMPHVEFGPRNLHEAVKNMTILATCQWRPRLCPAQPEPHPSAGKRKP